MNHDEHEWQLQEAALHDERSGQPPRSDDPLLARYRDVARALRAPPPVGLPDDFAVQVARRVAGVVEPDARFEQRLVGALVALFGVAGVIVCLIYGADWWRSSATYVPDLGAGSMKWLLALGACIAASWTMGRTRPTPEA